MTRDPREWVVLPDCPKYEICREGDIRNRKTGLPVKVHAGGRYYPYVCLWQGSTKDTRKKRTRKMHQLLAALFIPNPERLPCVLHDDGNKENTSIANLKWGTYHDNEADKRRHGRSLVGEKNPQAVLSTESVLKIRRMASRGHSNAFLGRAFGVDRTTVSLIVLRKKWQHV